MTQPAIQVEDLHKSFGEILAVQGVSFNVQQSEIFSLLGPNGAGKTTTISMLATLLRPDQGDALVMGHSIRKDATAVREVLGVVPQEIALYDDLSARENLLFWGKMYGLRGAKLKARVDEALEIIGLTERAAGQVAKFSGGMKRRVNIAAALLHRPAVIFMDEPTVGIDPQSRRNILDSVVRLKEQGMTVLYTTHYMEEAQELSDHIAIMDHGKLIAMGSHAELVKIVGEADRIRLAIFNPDESLAQAWGRIPGVEQVSCEDGVFTILAHEGHHVLPRLFEAAGDQAARITSVEIQQPDLEAVFLHLTGRALRD
jgi:ABC-2 type transport system ATP-binding protein